MKRIIEILLPFFATLFLWRLSFNFLNPNGILAFVPIFYYSVIRDRGGFLPMALIGCFLLDNNFNTALFWTILFCLFYAIIGLQTVINPLNQRLRGLDLFMVFIGGGFTILGIWAAFITKSLLPILTGLHMFIVGIIGYILLTYLFEKIECWIKK